MANQWRVDTYEGRLLLCMILLIGAVLSLFATNYQEPGLPGQGKGDHIAAYGSPVPPSSVEAHEIEPLQVVTPPGTDNPASQRAMTNSAAVVTSKKRAKPARGYSQQFAYYPTAPASNDNPVSLLPLPQLF